ncbi:ATP-dependent zinc metalloprotease FtsH [Seleniivibrio woodruffii]|uniref:ATP-dependent zinc metalloprotease FtsH n=2 Tax=Seleniivibrio woodruffii TaxID=1078050 RepID=A0A4R1K911_9BACT|nr:ATP-dependent zinc metalloprotease FtsH [Seleniivibrio woodruffii]TCK60866.1 cell division protease FtsH [Seleniivibrio woodruffii]TVZ36496.1 membrane protease FtsH catalytic subunit [Seleniivibrio woodruffii]
MNNGFYKNLALWLVIAFIMVFLFNVISGTQAVKKNISYSEFTTQVMANKVKSVTIKQNKIDGVFVEGGQFESYSPDDIELIKMLREHKVEITAQPPDKSPWYMQVLVSWLPMIILIGIWIFFMRQMQGGAGGKAFSFGKSKAKLLTQDQHKVTFKDVAGIEEAKEELEEIIDFLKDPQKFQKLGGKIPKGVLLVGPPGTGKTLLARAVAGEAGVPFFSISGSDFVEMFVGVGAARVRDLFEQGKKNAPCIIFVDEIDAVGRHRGAGLGGGHDEREQTLNQMLVEMDGFESNEGVIMIAATNRPDVLDPALLRPGRFDRQVVVPRPDMNGRLEILTVHSSKVKMEEGIDLEVIAKGTPGFAGAELANLVNEAALIAARKNKEAVQMIDFEEAKDKVIMGKERRSMVISDKEKENTAYHEAGHAIVAKLIPEADPVHKVSIIPRGMALGVTMQLPVDDRHMYTKDYMESMLAVLMGGRVAEEVIFDRLSTGAGNDIERATGIARKMVCSWGMSKKMGPLAYGKKDEQVFLGKEIGHAKDYSETTAIAIDDEVKALVMDGYNRARRILEDNTELLHSVAKLLLEKETIDGHEIDKLMSGEAESEPEAKAEETLV